MSSKSLDRAQIAHLRAQAPEAYREMSADLRDFYGRKLLGIHGRYGRRMMGREYHDARVAMLIRLAQEIRHL